MKKYVERIRRRVSRLFGDPRDSLHTKLVEHGVRVKKETLPSEEEEIKRMNEALNELEKKGFLFSHVVEFLRPKDPEELLKNSEVLFRAIRAFLEGKKKKEKIFVYPPYPYFAGSPETTKKLAPASKSFYTTSVMLDFLEKHTKGDKEAREKLLSYYQALKKHIVELYERGTLPVERVNDHEHVPLDAEKISEQIERGDTSKVSDVVLRKDKIKIKEALKMLGIHKHAKKYVKGVDLDEYVPVYRNPRGEVRFSKDLLELVKIIKQKKPPRVALTAKGRLKKRIVEENVKEAILTVLRLLKEGRASPVVLVKLEKGEE